MASSRICTISSLLLTCAAVVNLNDNRVSKIMGLDPSPPTNSPQSIEDMVANQLTIDENDNRLHSQPSKPSVHPRFRAISISTRKIGEKMIGATDLLPENMFTVVDPLLSAPMFQSCCRICTENFDYDLNFLSISTKDIPWKANLKKVYESAGELKVGPTVRQFRSTILARIPCCNVCKEQLLRPRDFGEMEFLELEYEPISPKQSAQFKAGALLNSEVSSYDAEGICCKLCPSIRAFSKAVDESGPLGMVVPGRGDNGMSPGAPGREVFLQTRSTLRTYAKALSQSKSKGFGNLPAGGGAEPEAKAPLQETAQGCCPVCPPLRNPTKEPHGGPFGLKVISSS